MLDVAHVDVGGMGELIVVEDGVFGGRPVEPAGPLSRFDEKASMDAV